MVIKKKILTILKDIAKKLKNLIEPKYIKPEKRFSSQNYGIIKRLNEIIPTPTSSDKNEFRKKILDVYGIQIKYPISLREKTEGIKKIKVRLQHEGIIYDESYFHSYDGIKIPVYVVYPPNFNNKQKYPTIILFSGHGSAFQLAFEKTSYQHGGGAKLAENGFLVYIMENRGMGKLSYLGNHLRIDAVAKVTGGTWYGELITDALYLVENLHKEPNVDFSRIGTAGVSTGGAISMITSSLDERITATYVQGFLGSYRTSFGIRGSHCLCGHIPGILKVADMSDIASLIAPRPVLFVNGTKDSFYVEDAQKAFNEIKKEYFSQGVNEKSKFLAPIGIAHEFSVDIAIKWFSEQLR
jgi:dienelactone hydrolase